MSDSLKWKRVQSDGEGPSEVWRARTAHGYLVAFGAGRSPAHVVYVPEPDWNVALEHEDLDEVTKRPRHV